MTQHSDKIGWFLGYAPQVVFEALKAAEANGPDAAYIAFSGYKMHEHEEVIDIVFYQYDGIEDLLRKIKIEDDELKYLTDQALEEIAAREEEAAALEEHWRSQAASLSSEKPTTENYW